LGGSLLLPDTVARGASLLGAVLRAGAGSGRA
jgi:hypothetical protein